MFKHFVPSEFYKFHLKSWVQQFEYAIHLIDTQPKTALLYLVDTDYERWKSICDNIDNIDRVALAIEFLGRSLDTKKRCCQPQYRKIEHTIEVAKFASRKRRIIKLNFQIKDAKDKKKMLLKNLEMIDAKIEQWKIEIDDLNKQLKTLSLEQKNKLAILQGEIVQIYKQKLKMKDMIKRYKTKINILERHFIAMQNFDMSPIL